MLMFSRGMHHYLRAQMAGEWRRQIAGFQMGELNGQTLGIIGLGRIGEGLAVRAKACGMRVVALKRNPHSRYDSTIALDALYAPDELSHLLAESDHVCISVPYTPETHHWIDAAALAQMKPTAYLYNIARGKVIDEGALIAALQECRIAGAGLDVFAQEPLPTDSMSPAGRRTTSPVSPNFSAQTCAAIFRTSRFTTSTILREATDRFAF
jgi:phosphoglycerate dehydrogenase-like enzyme